jgi:hypothetical protein
MKPLRPFILMGSIALPALLYGTGVIPKPSAKYMERALQTLNAQSLETPPHRDIMQHQASGHIPTAKVTGVVASRGISILEDPDGNVIRARRFLAVGSEWRNVRINPDGKFRGTLAKGVQEVCRESLELKGGGVWFGGVPLDQTGQVRVRNCR